MIETHRSRADHDMGRAVDAMESMAAGPKSQPGSSVSSAQDCLFNLVLASTCNQVRGYAGAVERSGARSGASVKRMIAGTAETVKSGKNGR